MNREIRFKAKRLDGKGWVVGYFYQECGNTYIIEDRQNESSLNRNHPFEVDPSTVCQYTGLKDKEGKEIWEGDVVEHIIFDLYKGSVEQKGVVVYRGCSFYILSSDRLTYSLLASKVIVVGNQFDKEDKA